MSTSKRGRKRNENLPPNRARDVQRAFRARRAAHLQSLEERVEILEDENARLREALGMPQADRPVLGRGPTGKDKVKPFVPQHPRDAYPPPSSPSEQLSSSTNSSPGSPATGLSNATPQSSGFEPIRWSEPPIVMPEHLEPPSPPSVRGEEDVHHHQQHSYKQLPSYPLSRGVPHPLSSHSNASPPNLPNLYIPPAGQQQFHTPSPTDYSPNYAVSELQDDVPSFTYRPSQPPPMMPPRHHYPGDHDQHHQSPARQYTPERTQEYYPTGPSTSGAVYGHRRSVTETFAIRPSPGLSYMGQHYPSTQHQHNAAIRLPSPPRLAMDARVHGGQPVSAIIE